jgi:hypothetical protein
MPSPARCLPNPFTQGLEAPAIVDEAAVWAHITTKILPQFEEIEEKLAMPYSKSGGGVEWLSDPSVYTGGYARRLPRPAPAASPPGDASKTSKHFTHVALILVDFSVVRAQWRGRLCPAKGWTPPAGEGPARVGGLPPACPFPCAGMPPRSRSRRRRPCLFLLRRPRRPLHRLRREPRPRQHPGLGSRLPAAPQDRGASDEALRG